MSLFDDEPVRGARSGSDWEQHRAHRQPFAGRPRDEVGIPVASGAELGRGDDVVVSLRSLTAYSDGLALDVVVLFSDEQHAAGDLADYTRNPGRFRLGVRYADGSRATTGNRASPDVVGSVAGPLLTLQGSRTSVLRWEGEYWLWPLPPPGRLEAGCRWPDRGIGDRLVELDAQPLLDAAARSRPVWCP